MTSGRITVRIPRNLQKKIAALVRETGKSESEITRTALEDYCQRQVAEKSAYDVFLEAGLIGDAKGLPSDLSTNPKYMEGFGRD